ncbi:MAG: hypothetical protein ABIR70_02880 [Bryobacteraceae bacterium]
MRLAAFCFVTALSFGQQPPPDLALKGDRFAPLTWDIMTPEQLLV